MAKPMDASHTHHLFRISRLYLKINYNKGTWNKVMGWVQDEVNLTVRNESYP